MTTDNRWRTITKKKLVDHLKLYPDDAEIFFHPEGSDEIISMGIPPLLTNKEYDGKGLKAVIFHIDDRSEACILDYNRTHYGK